MWVVPKERPHLTYRMSKLTRCGITSIYKKMRECLSNVDLILMWLQSIVCATDVTPRSGPLMSHQLQAMCASTPSLKLRLFSSSLSDLSNNHTHDPIKLLWEDIFRLQNLTNIELGIKIYFLNILIKFYQKL